MKALIISLSMLLFPIYVLAENNVTICETMPNPDGTDTKENEYLKIKNNTVADINFAGWKVCNISNDCYALSGEIKIGACLKIFRNDFVFTLHNDKEQLSLYDQTGLLVNQTITGTAPSGKAWLCSNEFCEWGEARESCDYADVTDDSQLTTDNENSNQNNSNNQQQTTNNVSDTTNNEEQNNPLNSQNSLNIEISNEQSNKNTNTNLNADKKANFEIAKLKDWEQAKQEMNGKNLLSLKADLEGKITVPYNLVKNNAFYIRVARRLVQVNIYSSRQNEFSENSLLYQEGTKVAIKNGFLKNAQQTWQVGVGKGTELTINRGKSGGTRNLTSLSNVGDIKKQEGENVEISGKILRKSGSYFYVENEKDTSQVYTLYIPSSVWARYLDLQNIGLFPAFVEGKIATATDFKGKNIKAVGIIETSEKSYRIVVKDEKDIVIGDLLLVTSDKKNNEKKTLIGAKVKINNTALGPKIEAENNSDTPTYAPSSLKATVGRQEGITPSLQRGDEGKVGLESSRDNLLSNLKAVLVQKISWKILAEALVGKIKQKIGNWF